MNSQEKERIKKRIASLEKSLEKERSGVYCHFTSQNISMLINQICDLKSELNKKD